jgi:probable HAF family extracellular repeat protein
VSSDCAVLISFQFLLTGDFVSLPPCCHSINNRGQVVGFSFPGPQGSGRAVLWQNKVPIDLNTLIPKDSSWYLLDALSINDDREIVGYGTI